MTTIDLTIPDYLRRDKDNKMPEISKPLVYSFTMLNTADTCLHRCYRQYVKRDIPYVPTPEMEFGNEVHTAMEHRVGGKPLPEKMRHWEPIAATFARPGARSEMEDGRYPRRKPAEFFGKDVFLRGKIDVTLIEGTSAFLPDWKTGGSRYEDPFELENPGADAQDRQSLFDQNWRVLRVAQGKPNWQALRSDRRQFDVGEGSQTRSR